MGEWVLVFMLGGAPVAVAGPYETVEACQKQERRLQLQETKTGVNCWTRKKFKAAVEDWVFEYRPSDGYQDPRRARRGRNS